jgi:hypothetical protein
LTGQAVAIAVSTNLETSPLLTTFQPPVSCAALGRLFNFNGVGDAWRRGVALPRRQSAVFRVADIGFLAGIPQLWLEPVFRRYWRLRHQVIGSCLGYT